MLPAVQATSRISGPETDLQTTMSPFEQLADLDLPLPVPHPRKRKPHDILCPIFSGCQPTVNEGRHAALRLSKCLLSTLWMHAGRWSGRSFPAKLGTERGLMPDAVAT